MEYLHGIIPPTIFGHLSTLHQHLVQYASSIDVDPGVYRAVNAGVLIGIGIISFLAFFPGEPFDYSTIENDNGDGNGKNTNTTKDKSSSSDTTDSKNARKNSDQERKVEEGEGDYYGSKMNIIGIFNATFYGFLLLGGMYILEHSYGLSAVALFRWYFPREAAVLGL